MQQRQKRRRDASPLECSIAFAPFLAGLSQLSTNANRSLLADPCRWPSFAWRRQIVPHGRPPDDLRRQQRQTAIGTIFRRRHDRSDAAQVQRAPVRSARKSSLDQLWQALHRERLRVLQHRMASPMIEKQLLDIRKGGTDGPLRVDVGDRRRRGDWQFVSGVAPAGSTGRDRQPQGSPNLRRA